MASTDITNRFLNQDKRYDEAVVVTVPAILSQGGGRSQAQPIYLQGGESVKAGVIEPDTIITGAFLIVDEAFPAGATVSVDIAGTSYFGSVDVTGTGMTVSTETNNFLAKSQTLVVVVSGVAGDITTGKLRVVLDTIHPSLKNGQFAS